MLSISGHKIYGPKGIGALICKDNPLDYLEPIILGGYQEAGIRSGTLPTNLCIGLAESIKILSKERKNYVEHYRSLKHTLWHSLFARNNKIEQNSPKAEHPGTLNLYFPGVDGEALCMQLANKVAISTAAACNSSEYEYSYVLKSMGYKVDRCKNSVRLCVGRQNSERDILKASDNIMKSYEYLLKI